MAVGRSSFPNGNIILPIRGGTIFPFNFPLAFLENKKSTFHVRISFSGCHREYHPSLRGSWKIVGHGCGNIILPEWEHHPSRMRCNYFSVYFLFSFFRKIKFHIPCSNIMFRVLLGISCFPEGNIIIPIAHDSASRQEVGSCREYHASGQGISSFPF